MLGDDSKIAELESKKSENLIVIYVTGVALGGYMELVELLLEKGADDNQLPAEFVMGENAQ